MFADQQRQSEAANAAEFAWTEKIDSFWCDFLAELRHLTDEFNSRTKLHEQIPVTTPQPEPNAFALRKDGEFGGQLVARLFKEERRGEVCRWMGRSIQIIDCPIAVREHDLELAFLMDNGELVDCKPAARWFMETYFRWTLALIHEELPEGERRIGFRT